MLKIRDSGGNGQICEKVTTFGNFLKKLKMNDLIPLGGLYEIS